MPAEVADHGCAERIEGGDAAIDVEIRLFSGGKGERSGADGFLEEKGFEVGCSLEHGQMFGVSAERFNRESVGSGIVFNP